MKTRLARLASRVQTDGQAEILTGASHLGRDTAVGTVTRLQARRCGVRIPVSTNFVSLHQNVQTDSSARPASC
jgi:hypothetical protein